MDKEKLSHKLLEFFRFSGKPLQLSEITKSLNIPSMSGEYELLKIILNDFVGQKLIDKSSRRRYSIRSFDSSATITGVIRIKNDRGVIVPAPVAAAEKIDDKRKPKNKKSEKEPKTPKIELVNLRKVVIKRRNFHTALDGDTVLVNLHAERKGKKLQGTITKILKRDDRKITGTIEFDGYFYFLIPDEEIYYIDFLIPENKLNGANSGDKVAAKFLRWDDPQKSPEASIIRIIGTAGEPKAEYDAILSEFNLPREFPAEVEQEAQAINSGIVKKEEIEEVKGSKGQKVNKSIGQKEEVVNKSIGQKEEVKNRKSKIDLKDRKDFRKDLVITIDPEDAKDFDDALSLKILENGNYQLGVHIADVSTYVEEGGLIDREALNRGTSTYLVDRVVPMLPEVLSNDICSLKPNRVRFTFSVLMEFNKQGNLKHYEITESVIRSRKRFSYNEVQEIIDRCDGNKPENDIEHLVVSLNELASILRKQRYSIGGIEFETTEIKFLLDENKNPVKAILKQPIPATGLVEECMLAANKTIAEHVRKMSKLKSISMLPFLYRVHDKPLEEKIKEVLAFIKLNYKSRMPSKVTAKEINKFLEQFEGKPEKPIIHKMFIRSMPKAEYTSRNIGHFGLGFSEYTHFTSPIRRYPDLVVHRLIKEYNKDEITRGRIKLLEKRLEGIGVHCTEMERHAMEAERASVKLASTVLAKNFVGKEFYGTVSGVTSFGLFVLLDDIYTEGLVHMRDLADDYYIFDEANFQLIGRRKNRKFHFGMRIKVKIISANIEKRKVDLQFIESR